MKLYQKLSILFWVWKSKTDEEGMSPIYVRITIDGIRSQFSLGVKIKASVFNNKSGKARGNSPEASLVNNEINIARGKLQQYYNVLSIQHKFVAPEMLKQVYFGKNMPNKSLLQIITYHNNIFLEKVSARTRSKATLKKYNATKEKIKGYLKSNYGLDDIPLSEIKLSFAEDFQHYLSVYEHLENNTIMKHIKNLKKIFMLAVNKEWIPNSPIASFRCSYQSSEREKLDESELRILLNARFDRKALEEARDCYIAMCFTGYAYKDAALLTQENIKVMDDGSKWFIKNREKTACKENVPILPIVEKLIEKYKSHPFCVAYNKVFPIHSNQKFNNCLKDIAKLCGIKKILTTHTARHTFATTITLSNGVPIETVSALLGHSSIRTTQIYAKVVAKKISEDMQLLQHKLDAIDSNTKMKAV